MTTLREQRMRRQERAQQIHKLVMQGKTADQLAQKFNLSRARIYQLVGPIQALQQREEDRIMAIAKKPATINARAKKFVAAAANHSTADSGLDLVNYSFRLDAALLQQVKIAAAQASVKAGHNVTVTSWMVNAIVEKIRKQDGVVE